METNIETDSARVIKPFNNSVRFWVIGTGIYLLRVDQLADFFDQNTEKNCFLRQITRCEGHHGNKGFHPPTGNKRGINRGDRKGIRPLHKSITEHNNITITLSRGRERTQTIERIDAHWNGHQWIPLTQITVEVSLYRNMLN